MTEYFTILINAHKTMHLIGYSYRGDLHLPGFDLTEDIRRRQLEVLPPTLRVLLGPSGLYGDDSVLMLGIERARGDPAAFSVHETRLDRRASDIIT